MPGAFACAILLLAKPCLLLRLASPRFAADGSPYPVGLKQIEFTDGDRHIALAMFYPAALTDKSATPTGLPFFINLHLYRDAALAEGRHPLVMLSHGRGSNPLLYAWFAQTLAAQGYIVAGLYHYRANSYDQTIAYLANKLWQRPRDISLAIDFLLKDPAWGQAIDARGSASPAIRKAASPRFGSAAPRSMRTNILAFQKGWKNNQAVPAHLRDELPLDPAPALDVSDKRIKAAFAMAPGIIKAFGMDEAGLAPMTSRPTSPSARATRRRRRRRTAHSPPSIFRAPSSSSFPASSTTRSSSMNATTKGRDEFPEACIDAPGVDAPAIHKDVGAAALNSSRQNLNREGGNAMIARLAARSSVCFVMAFIVFGGTYLVAAGIWLAVTRLAVDDRGRAFKALIAGHAAAARHHLRPARRFHRRAGVERFREGQNRRRQRSERASLCHPPGANNFPDEQGSRLRKLVNEHIETAVNAGVAGHGAPTRQARSGADEIGRSAQHHARSGAGGARTEIGAERDRAIDRDRLGRAASAHHHQPIDGEHHQMGRLLLQALCTLIAISFVHCDNRATCAMALALFATGVAASVLLIAVLQPALHRRQFRSNPGCCSRSSSARARPTPVRRRPRPRTRA